MGAAGDAERLVGLYKEMLATAAQQRDLAGSGDFPGVDAASQIRSSLEAGVDSIMEQLSRYPEEQRRAPGVVSLVAEAARIAEEIVTVDRHTLSALEKRKSELAGQISDADQRRVAMQGYRSALDPRRKTRPRFIDKSR